MNIQIEDILRRVGKELKKQCGNIAYEEKSDAPADVVTELDRWAEKEIFSELKKIDSSVECVGEEFGGDRTAEKFWLLDPIDGTAHFVRGTHMCSTMLAKIEHGEVVESYIYLFMLDEMYSARKGEGACMNGKKIQVSNRGIKEAYFGLETRIEDKQNRQIYDYVMQTCGVPLRTMTAGYEFALLASGKIDARIQVDPYGKDYDFAPGALLVKEAGGAVRNLGGEAYDYTNTSFIAASKEFEKEFADRIEKGILGI